MLITRIRLFAYHAQSLISSKMNPQTQKLRAEADPVCDATVVWYSSLTHTLSLSLSFSLSLSLSLSPSPSLPKNNEYNF